MKIRLKIYFRRRIVGRYPTEVKPMFCYPATLERDPETGMVVVGFPDIPYCHSVGEDEDEALLNAEDALITAFESCEDRREPIPTPSPSEAGQAVVVLPVLMAQSPAIQRHARIRQTQSRFGPLAQRVPTLGGPADFPPPQKPNRTN